MMKNLLFILLCILNSFNSQSQCACVWVDINGNIQCYLYSNCSGPNLTNCASKVTGGTMCPCYVYPGMNWNCGGCQSNGACWYNGTACDADLVCGYVSMPIELIYFKGESVDGVNKLEWSTASEMNNSYFMIEYSTNGIDFITISNIPGAGNSTQSIKYQAYHIDPENSINYYRLSQVDFDGRKEVFDIIAIDNLTKEKESIVKIINSIGQEVDVNYSGIKFVCYSDGTVIKKM